MRSYFTPERFQVFQQELKSWLGTPYWRNEGIKGRGADCSLFIARSLVQIGVLEKVEKPAYLPRDWQTHGMQDIFLKHFMEHKKFLKAGLDIENVIGPYQAGDWMLFSTSMRRLANHSSIYLGDGNVIHATEQNGVIIEKFSKWQKHLKTVFRLVENGD